MAWLEDTVARKKRILADRLQEPLERLFRDCEAAWPDPETLDRALAAGHAALPDASLLYALDPAGRQVSSNVSPAGPEATYRGQALAGRPFLEGALPFQGLVLSPPYLSRANGTPCITALHALRSDQQLLGFLAADFQLHDLPLETEAAEDGPVWRQFKGDPAIRDTLFLQRRVRSTMDERMGDTLLIVGNLLAHHGIFHAKLHFSSARVTLWSVDDPFTYRIHGVEEITDPGVCLAYPRRAFPERSQVARDEIAPILERFRALREADETIYLRSASLNLINGLTGLTFSCDGSHYMAARELLDRDMGFWLGEPVARQR